MDPSLPFSKEWKEPSKSNFGIGPPPPDIVNPLDRLARRPRPVPHNAPVPFPFPPPRLPPPGGALHDTMSLNFAPPPRAKINSHNSNTSPKSVTHMKESNESSLMTEQENVVVTDVIKNEGEEGGAGSDGEVPPPPPPAKHAEEGEHSEEGECDSDPEDGEIGEGQGDARRKDSRHQESRNRKSKQSPRDNVIPLVKKTPGPPVPQLDPVQRKLERIASKQASPYRGDREHSYRDRNFRERGPDRGPERDDTKRNNGANHDERSRFPSPRDNRSLDKYNRQPPDYRRDGKSMRPGDMPSLISLPPMPVISSSSKGKVPDFPPLSFGASAGLPPPPMPPPIPPLIPPVPGAAWPPPPGPIPPMAGRHDRGDRRDDRDGKFDDVKIKESFDMYHKAWESYYADMAKDRPKSSREKNFVPERRSRSPGPPDTRERYSAPPPATGGTHHPPGIPPAPFPPGIMPGMPGMPPHMIPPGSRAAKESAWERGLKVSKRIREEVKRNEKSDEDSEDSHPGMKLQSKIVMKENRIKSRSPSIPKGKSTRRLSPLSDGAGSSNGNHIQSQSNHIPRLTPERYRGAYERKPPPPEDPKKPKVPGPGGDADWHDPWMRPNSPKDRKRQLSRSSSSSDSSSDDSSPQHKRLQELKRTIDLAHRRRKAKKDAAKLKRLKEKLSPSEFELLTRKRSKKPSDTASKSKYESESGSDSDDSSNSSSSGGSLSPGTYAGKLADSPTSPLSSPDFSYYKDKKKTKEILMRQLQKVEKQLERKKKDEKRRHS